MKPRKAKTDLAVAAATSPSARTRRLAPSSRTPFGPPRTRSTRVECRPSVRKWVPRSHTGALLKSRKEASAIEAIPAVTGPVPAGEWLAISSHGRSTLRAAAATVDLRYQSSIHPWSYFRHRNRDFHRRLPFTRMAHVKAASNQLVRGMAIRERSGLISALSHTRCALRGFM